MFSPNPRILGRYADTRVNGLNDEQFESMMREASGRRYNPLPDKYNSEPRLESCVSEIIQEPDKTIDVNTFGNQDEYNKEMTDNLDNNNFSSRMKHMRERANKMNENSRESFENNYDDVNEHFDRPPVQVRCPEYHGMNPYPMCNNRYLSQRYPYYEQPMFNSSCSISNNTLIYCGIIFAIIIIFGIVFGVMIYKNNMLYEKVNTLETKLRTNDNKAPQVIMPTQVIEKKTPIENNREDRRTTGGRHGYYNDYNDYNYNNDYDNNYNRYVVSPQVPIRNNVL